MAIFRSPCSDLVGMPVDGPPRITSTTTTGISAEVARPSSSIISESPGPEVAVSSGDRNPRMARAEPFQGRREPFEDFGRRRDRIGGGKANAAADGAEGGRLVARQQPPVGGARRRRGELPAEIDAGCRAESDLDSGEARLAVSFKHLR